MLYLSENNLLQMLICYGRQLQLLNVFNCIIMLVIWRATGVILVVGSRAFFVAGPQAGNQLPVSLCHTVRVATFKRLLKLYCLRRCTV